MKQTLTNINAGVILQALRKASPCTVAGKAAVENFKSFLVNHTMSAIPLENAIISLTGPNRDAGLESLISILKGLMPESKRKVAVAYECLAMQSTTLFTGNRQAAMEAVATLYDMNAAKIIDAINDGKLDAFKTNPEIQRLIAWAKAAVKIKPEAPVPTTGDVQVTMVPVLNVATAGEDMLVAIDGKTFLQGKRGSMTYVPNVADYDNIPADIRALLVCLSKMHSSIAEPNLLVFDDDVMDQIRKNLPIETFAIDLLGGVNELVQINGNAMSTEKAMALLRVNSDDLLASLLTSDYAQDAIKIVSTAMQLFEKYRGVVNGNVFANKFSNDKGISVYMISKDNAISMVTMMDGSVVNTSAFSTIYEALGSEIAIANPQIHNAISNVFASELKDNARSISVKQQLVKQLSEERQNYENLLQRINTELDDLATVMDANPDKIKALNELKKKTTESIDKVKEELDNLGIK